MVYGYLARTCLALDNTEEAFTVVEEGRSRVLREQLAEQNAVSSSVGMTLLDLGEALDWLQCKELLK